MRSALIKVGEGGLLDTIRKLLRDLLEKRVVEAVLVPVELPSGNNVVQTLVTSPDKLQIANPLAPVLPVNSARIVSAMTRLASSQKKIGVVLRSCELRAVVELVKLRQVHLENLVLIGVDCYGTYSMDDYHKLAGEGKAPTERALDLFKKSEEDSLLREACQVCEYPFPLVSDITIGLFGLDPDKEVLVQANSPEGEKILETLELGEGDDGGKRQAAIEKLVELKKKNLEKLFERTGTDMSGEEKLLTSFARCINCHNCRDACPICYCRECVFDSPTFEFNAEKYMELAARKELLKMPTDMLLFHLTRMTHMAHSCIGCGLCEEACPNDVPVFGVFRTVGANVQDTFDYVPGRSIDDEMPMTTFREDELQEVGYE